MSRVFVAVVMVLAMASTSFGAVELRLETTKITGSELYETIVSVNDTSSFSGAWSTTAMTFTGANGLVFNQSKRGAFNVNTYSAALALDGVSGYEMAVDTYYYDISDPENEESYLWNGFPNPATAITGTSSLTVHLGTAFGVLLSGKVPMLHLVSTAGTIYITGSLARNGQFHDVSNIPEPSSVAMVGGLFGFGALVALFRRRR